MSRQQEWKEIWEAKGRRKTDAAHVMDGYDVVDANGWERLVRALVAPIRFQPGMRVLELGCGAGAFLGMIGRIAPGVSLAGMDYAESMVEVARTRLTGEFVVGNICDCPCVASSSADVTCSFGVLLYLDSEAEVRQAIREIDRVTKPGGQIYIGEISDVAKRDVAERVRTVTHANRDLVSTKRPTHFYLPKELFADEARRLGWERVRILSHSDVPGMEDSPAAGYRFSVYAEKRG